LMQELEAVRRGDVDVIVGTQVVAKGHTFPHLTLVGVVDADVALNSADPRAAERTFQLMTQVVGRAGRGAVKGRAFLQSYAVEHPVLQALAAYDRLGFYRLEMETRQRAQLPPYARLALVHVSGPDPHVAEAYAMAMRAAWPSVDGDVRLFGPTPAPVAVVRGRHRFRFLLRGARGLSLQKVLKRWLAAVDAPSKGIKVHVDVDPYFFL
jgi:primosomal protein N' (replication factor Y)